MKLKEEFEQFYKDIRIDGEQNTLIQKRTTLESEIKDKLPEIMGDHDIELKKSEIRMDGTTICWSSQQIGLKQVILCTTMIYAVLQKQLPTS